MSGSVPAQVQGDETLGPHPTAAIVAALVPVASGLVALALSASPGVCVVATAVPAMVAAAWWWAAARRGSTGAAAIAGGARMHAEVVERAYEAFVAMDGDGRIVGWNARAEAIFGWPRDEAIGRELADLIVPPQHREAHRAGLANYLSTGVGPVINRRIEITAWHRLEREFPVELAIWAVPADDGTMFNAFIQDISDRRRSETDREDLAANLRMLLETSGEGIFEVDLLGHWTYVNATAADLLGLDRHQVIGYDACRLVHRSGIDGTCDHQTCVIRYALHTGERARYDSDRFHRADGTSFVADCRTHPTVVSGKVQGAVVVFTRRLAMSERPELAATPATAGSRGRYALDEDARP
jgi:PAS domain S-box-containing protein